MGHEPKSGGTTGLFLAAATAGDLMVANPISISDKATVKEAITFLAQKGFSAAPVIDDAGRPVGDISRTDIITYTHAMDEQLPPGPEYYEKSDLTAPADESWGREVRAGDIDRTQVREIMTQAGFSVMPQTPVDKLVEQFLVLKVHRLFVVDAAGVLIGLISALDVLRHLR